MWPSMNLGERLTLPLEVRPAERDTYAYPPLGWRDDNCGSI